MSTNRRYTSSVEWIFLLVTVAAAAFAIWQGFTARSARAEARRILAECVSLVAAARELESTTTEALGRQTKALERANELAEAVLPTDIAKWQLVHFGRARWGLRNIGTRRAELATLFDVTVKQGFIKIENSTAVDVEPDAHLEFILRTAHDSPDPRVQVRWRETDGPMQSKAFALSL